MGRRPLIHDEQLVNTLLTYIEKGNTLGTSAGRAGLSASTIGVWVRRGENAQALVEAGDDVDAEEEVYIAFARRLARARAKGEAALEDVILERSQSDPDKAMAYLKNAPGSSWNEYTREMNARVKELQAQVERLMAGGGFGQLTRAEAQELTRRIVEDPALSDAIDLLHATIAEIRREP